jgi:hypothetical protein
VTEQDPDVLQTISVVLPEAILECIVEAINPLVVNARPVTVPIVLDRCQLPGDNINP